MEGNDNITSHMRISSASSQPPTNPASNPRATPTPTDSSTEARPTANEMRVPYISADKMSRPWSSVPRKNDGLPPSDHDGGKRALLSSSVVRSNGLCGATHGANTAQNTQMKANKAAPMATGDDRKL